jgi:hypothetical protein
MAPKKGYQPEDPRTARVRAESINRAEKYLEGQEFHSMSNHGTPTLVDINETNADSILSRLERLIHPHVPPGAQRPTGPEHEE